MRREQIINYTPFKVKTKYRTSMVGSITMTIPDKFIIKDENESYLTLNSQQKAKDFCGLYNGAARSGVLEAMDMLDNKELSELDSVDVYTLNPITNALLFQDDEIYKFKSVKGPDIEHIVESLNRTFVVYLNNYLIENRPSIDNSFAPN